MMGRMGEPIVMVDAGPLAYLWQAFEDMGPSRSTANGREPWGWSDTRAFAEAFLPDTEAWEIKALEAMSRAYCAEAATATSPTRLSPVAIHLGEGWAAHLPPDAAPGVTVRLTLPEVE